MSPKPSVAPLHHPGHEPDTATPRRMTDAEREAMFDAETDYTPSDLTTMTPAEFSDYEAAAEKAARSGDAFRSCIKNAERMRDEDHDGLLRVELARIEAILDDITDASYDMKCVLRAILDRRKYGER